MMMLMTMKMICEAVFYIIFSPIRETIKFPF